MQAVAIIAAIASTAIGAVNTYQQGKNEQTIANYNARIQQENARMQMLGMQAAAAQQKAAAEANFRLAQGEANARFANADVMEANALIRDRINRINLAARREEMARRQAEQRAQIAASGVLETGTPLDLEVETAATIQKDQEEQFWGMENERRTLFNEASMERFGGKMAMAGAMIQRKTDMGEAALTALTGRAKYLAGRSEAEITRLTGLAAFRAAKLGTAATIFGGVSNAAGKAA